jgi:hypothetical protein
LEHLTAAEKQELARLTANQPILSGKFS